MRLDALRPPGQRRVRTCVALAAAGAACNVDNDCQDGMSCQGSACVIYGAGAVCAGGKCVVPDPAQCN